MRGCRSTSVAGSLCLYMDEATGRNTLLTESSATKTIRRQDFKVAGTQQGVNASTLDLKNLGITEEIHPRDLATGRKRPASRS